MTNDHYDDGIIPLIMVAFVLGMCFWGFLVEPTFDVSDYKSEADTLEVTTCIEDTTSEKTKIGAAGSIFWNGNQVKLDYSSDDAPIISGDPTQLAQVEDCWKN